MNDHCYSGNYILCTKKGGGKNDEVQSLMRSDNWHYKHLGNNFLGECYQDISLQ